jgi:dimethylaniline monooxygenase (N-oxide forming)
MHEVAGDIGAAPDILDRRMLANPRVLTSYCLGQAYITFFRLQGPFAHEKAWEVSANELFEPVVDRGMFSNAVFLSLIGMFGAINLGAYAVERTFNL